MKWSEYVAEFQKHGWWDCKAINRRSGERIAATRRATSLRRRRAALSATMASPMRSTPLASALPPRRWSCGTPRSRRSCPILRGMFYRVHRASDVAEGGSERCAEYPFIATSGRRIPVYFHSEHRQLPWCREQWPAPRVEINPEDAAELGIEQGDWVWIETPEGKIRQTADLYYGIKTGVSTLSISGGSRNLIRLTRVSTFRAAIVWLGLALGIRTASAEQATFAPTR